MSLYDDIVARMAELGTRFAGRNQSIEVYRKLWEMPENPEEPGYTHIGPNIAHTSVNLAVAKLATNPVVYRYVSRSEDPSEERLATQVERLAHVNDRAADEMSVDRGRSIFQLELAQQMVLDGWYALEGLIEPGADSPLQTRLLDVPEVFPSWSNTRMEECYHSYITTFGDIERRYGAKLADPQMWAKVIVAWYYESGKVRNTVMTGATDQRSRVGYEVLRDAYEPGLERIPILTGPVRGAHYSLGTPRKPTSETLVLWDNFQDLSGLRGMSFLYGVKELVKSHDRILSVIGTIAHKYAEPTIVVKTRAGAVREIKLGAGEINKVLQDESVEVLAVSGSPPDMAVILAEVKKMLHQGTLPESAWGEASKEAAGFSAVLSSMSIGQALVPWSRMQDRVHSMRASLVLGQFRHLSNAQARKFRDMWGLDEFGSAFVLGDLDPKQVRYLDIMAHAPVSVPQDDLHRANIAVLLQQFGLPKEYIMDTVLQVPEPGRRLRQRLVEDVASDPEIRIAEAVEEMVRRKRWVAASILAKRAGVPIGETGKTGSQEMDLRNPATGQVERKLPFPGAQSSNEAAGTPLATAPAAQTTGQAPQGDQLSKLVAQGRGGL